MEGIQKHFQPKYLKSLQKVLYYKFKPRIFAKKNFFSSMMLIFPEMLGKPTHSAHSLD